MSCRTEEGEESLADHASRTFHPTQSQGEGEFAAVRPRIRETDPILGDIYLAGERVSPGIYRQIGASREVRLDQEDYLPASLDGRVACYERIALTRAVVIAAAARGKESPCA